MSDSFFFTEDIQDYLNTIFVGPYSLHYDFKTEYDIEDIGRLHSMCRTIDSVYIESMLERWNSETLHIKNNDNEIIGVLICEYTYGRLDLHLVCGMYPGIGSILMTVFLLAVKQREKIYGDDFNYIYLDVAGGFTNPAVCLYDKFGFVENPEFDRTKHLEMILSLKNITEKKIIDIYQGDKQYKVQPLCKLKKSNFPRNAKLREDERYNTKHQRRTIEDAKKAFNARIVERYKHRYPPTMVLPPRTTSGTSAGKAPRTTAGTSAGKAPRTTAGLTRGKVPRTTTGKPGKAPRTTTGMPMKAPRTTTGTPGKAPRTAGKTLRRTDTNATRILKRTHCKFCD
jgi:hypothetical protein